ncbi:hypothetical protein I552_3581 [Mycobacterium xenopi 3993]|nr:hypothetical protein I552_3581 [Mycobacterium xenopi 3993]
MRRRLPGAGTATNCTSGQLASWNAGRVFDPPGVLGGGTILAAPRSAGLADAGRSPPPR